MGTMVYGRREAFWIAFAPGRTSRKGEAGGSAQTDRSIVAHLQRILNTRQGNVPIAHDYGCPI